MVNVKLNVNDLTFLHWQVVVHLYDITELYEIYDDTNTAVCDRISITIQRDL